MKEKIEQIAEKIQNHYELEKQENMTNKAVGRCYVSYGNKEQQLWITNLENSGSSKQRRDINNNVIGTDEGKETTYTKDGHPIYKNTKLGEALILFREGRHDVKVENGNTILLEIFNQSTYTSSNSGVTDILIRPTSINQPYSFRKITDILEYKKKFDKRLDDKEEQLGKAIGDEEIDRLTQEYNAIKQEKQAALDKAQSFIRQYAKLRHQPILDPFQERIKRSKIFDGSLIINGGPGTGKTTSLVQRIKFLISRSIKDYKPLTQSQEEILFNEPTCWIFYSPSELLALFLRDSMVKEGLTADKSRVKVWSSHKSDLVKEYKFIDPLTKKPFLVYKNKSQEIGLFSNNANEIKKIMATLEDSYINFQQEKLNKVTEIDVTPFKWKIIGQKIQNDINRRKNTKSIDELIRLFSNLDENFKKETKANSDEYETLIEKVTWRILLTIEKDEERKNTITALLKETKTIEGNEAEEEDEEIDIEKEDFNEKEEDEDTFDFRTELLKKLKPLCRKQALKKFDKNTKFDKKDKELLSLIPEIIEQNEYDSLEQTAYFKKFFERVTKGIVANVFREIPIIYKKHRKEQLRLKSSNWDLTLLEELVKKDNNKRIHSDEQALLLLFANNIVLKLANSFKPQYNSINHPYISGFKNHCKPVIGIDEATDFSVIDLMAMSSFGHPELSSVTLSGDLMQRMTSNGLTSWQDFTEVIPNTKIEDLTISYRQSPTLLSLAKTIYQKSTGQTANYESYMVKDEKEPKPLLFVSENEDDKLQWIADRILEIYKLYGGSIPSIAVFLPEESQLESFANNLGNLDTLADIDILVKACRDGQVLGEPNTVRVFSIKVIKGLEFEAVFFHNIDELPKSIDKEQENGNDLILKYMYVGLSRATFCLGMTTSNELPEGISFVTDSFDKTGKTWKYHSL